MSKRIKILIVEDSSADAELLVCELRRAGFDPEWERVDTEKDYLAKLDSGLDLILSDYQMPQFNGLQALALPNKRVGSYIPFIIVSGTIGEEMAVTAIKQGAADYLLKDRIARLGPAVQRVLLESEVSRAKKVLEAQLIESQKMEVLGHLAGGVAHDFNNVLAVIMGYTDLSVQELGLDHPVTKHIEEIRHASQRAAGLTQQLLVFSRRQKIQVVSLDLNEVIESMDKMIRRLVDGKIELTILSNPQIRHVIADSGYIWQVLMNLVINARDAMPDGGQITIKTESVKLDEAYVRDHSNAVAGDYAVLSVADTGGGMTEEVRQRLFEPFFTTKPAGKGTGLGLATCQTIIEHCGGHIDVASTIGKGTTFKVYFPQSGQLTKTVSGITQKTGPLRLGNETVLIVEDEPSVLQLAANLLKNRGYKVLTATNGQDALRAAREHTGSPIGLVMTDIIMPRMGGKVMAEWLRASYPDIKVLFTSGYTEESIAPEGVFEEGVDFLPKPYTQKTLTRKVRKLLDN